ncbi:amidohydrolase [Pseudothauera nasutitermitis]|uniref:Amidohydrolase n=1 Tax=Pseudothauera nasutitermitis TaxID=2565930 RepID=A0A4S4B3M3_9RHOO|nr:amidohydrolase [Pseudothauera nasutitermitis]THF67278.1 amidohydrolase [Pseudothauera nasutitermitis]
MSDTVIYPARKILTMAPWRPEATHVAVRDGRILGVGGLDKLRGWGEARIDERFANKVLLPGLVEGHCHLMAGTLWRYTYCGWFDVRDPDGRHVPASRSLDEVIATLGAAAAKSAGGAVTGWGFDPIYFGARRCSRADLDRVSTTRQVGLMHASCHIVNVNTAALEHAGLLRPGIEHPGIPLGEDGLPTGELKGPDAMGPVLEALGLHRSFLSGDERGILDFGRLCVRAGVTTATDLAAQHGDTEIDTLLRTTGAPDYPVRLVPLQRMIGTTPAEAVARARALKARSTERLRLGRIKVVADGSIQGFSARLRWPGYYNGAPAGLWYTAPEAMRECYTLALEHGVQVHTHTNGDEATELALDCIEQALRARPTPDHRFTIQHAQLANRAQFRRMATLGVSVNLFANHLFYWGDQHWSTTVGPERAARMNACASALREGVVLGIHSDAPITPLSPLFTAWCAVNRVSASGRVLGEHERIGLPEALHAITLGAAHTLQLDSEIGSIECGKRADFCVLEDDPGTAAPQALKDLRVWGTVQGGRIFRADA